MLSRCGRNPSSLGEGFRCLWVGEFQRKATADAEGRLHGDGAAVQLGEFEGKGESQSGALVLAIEATLDLVEGFEKAGQVFGGDPDAGVGDGKFEAIALGGYVERDGAAIGEFDGVGQEIEQDLFEAAAIGTTGEIAGDAVMQGELALVNLLL